MKILSIRQPWADLIVRGSKDIENRSWATRYRGPFLVHASLNIDREGCEEHKLDPKKLRRGGIVGMAEIVDCVSDHPSKWFSGPYGFLLRKAKRLPIVEWKGGLGLREAPPRLLKKLNLKG